MVWPSFKKLHTKTKRKGSLLDLLGVLVIITVFVIVGLISMKVYTGVKTTVENNFNNTVQEQTILDKGETAQNILLNSIPFILIAAFLSTIILAFLIPSHPVFMPISIIMLSILTFISFIYSNFLWNFMQSTYLVDIANAHPLLVNTIHYLPYLFVGFGVLLIIVMYSRSRAGEP